jgi:hypothetical protein
VTALTQNEDCLGANQAGAANDEYLHGLTFLVREVRGPSEGAARPAFRREDGINTDVTFSAILKCHSRRSLNHTGCLPSEGQPAEATLCKGAAVVSPYAPDSKLFGFLHH